MKIPQIMIGTFQCGNKEILHTLVRESISSGVYGFDTAPSYKTESLLGEILKIVQNERRLSRDKLYISDKVDAWQMRAYNGDVRPFVQDALKKLQTEYIDMMFVHWPIGEYIEQTWESLLKCKQQGLILNAGICNVRVRHLVDWKKIGIEPSFVQIERHPLRTCSLEMEYCKNNNISVFSYSPLGRMMPQIRDSVILKNLAKKYNKTIAQIILRWQLDSNACPIFTSTRQGRIKSNMDICNFKLTNDEIAQIESLNQNYKIFLESWGCPGF